MNVKALLNRSITSSLVILSSALSVLSGCSTQPLPALEDARKEVQQLQNDPIVTEKAPVALYDAEKALKKADQQWASTHDKVETEHLAYLAKGNVAIAKYTAQRKLADSEIKELENSRKKAVLEAREAQVKSLEEQLNALKAKKTERGLVVTIGDVLFDTAKANLKPAALNNLYRLASALRDYPTRNVLIEGHTDNVGSDEYNLDLSQRRALSVANFLLSNGIDQSRIITRGYGESYPVSTNKTAMGRQLNRRVEVVILNEGEAGDKYLRR